jgi:hypothetical protein
MKTLATSLLALLLTISPALASSPAGAESPTTSKARFYCGLLGNTALELESTTTAFSIRMSIWGEGMGELRGERRIEIDGNTVDAPLGTAEICLKGSRCSPIRARFELTEGSTVANTTIKGRMFWHDPNINAENSLPLAAIIAPKERSCN